MLRWFAPQPVLLGAGVVLGGILRAHGRRLAAAWGPALGSLVIVASLVWFHQLAAAGDADGVPGGHLAVLAGGTTLAAVVVALVPALLVRRAEVRLRPAFRVPVGIAGQTRGVAQALVLTAVGLGFAAVVSVLVTSRSGVGVLPVLAYAQGVLLVPYAALLLPVVTGALPLLAGMHGGRGAPQRPAGTTVLTRSARHRRAPSVDTLAWRARSAAVLGAMGSAAVAAAAIPVGAFFGAIDAAHETDQGSSALDALTPGLWAAAPDPAAPRPRRGPLRRALRARASVRRRRGRGRGVAPGRGGTAGGGDARGHADLDSHRPRRRPGRGTDPRHARPARRDLSCVGARAPWRGWAGRWSSGSSGPRWVPPWGSCSDGGGPPTGRWRRRWPRWLSGSWERW